MDSSETPYFFVGENLALDLVNTEKMHRRQQRDLLETPADLADWWELAKSHHADIVKITGTQPLVFDMDLFETVKALRGNLRTLFDHVIEDQTPGAAETEFLNTILAKGSPTLIWEEQIPHYGYWCDSDTSAELLFPLALSALNLLTRQDLERLHHCESNHCILMFYDTTKSGTRRWCTTACMDRERSARRYREQKQKKRT